MKNQPRFVLFFIVVFSVAVALFTEPLAANFFPDPVPSGIRIESDGRVEPLRSLIRKTGKTYTLTGDIYNTIVVLRDDITLDGAGFTLHGNVVRTGVFVQEGNDVVIKNLTVSNFEYGIKFTWLNYGELSPARSNKVINCTLTDNQYGISGYDFSSGTEISGNSIVNNLYGVTSFSDAVFRNNRFINNNYSISEYIGRFNDVDSSNTVNGKPIYYWVNQHNKTVPSDAGWVSLKNCSGITVQGLSLEHNGDGISLYYTTNSIISGNVIVNNLNGILFMNSPCNTISDNQIMHNDGYGIHFSYDSSCNVVTRNLIVANAKDGICCAYSTNNTVTGNTITENIGHGVCFSSIQDSEIVANNITSNSGCGIDFESGSNGVVTQNFVAENGKGILIVTASGNRITFNNVVGHVGWGIELGGSQKDNVIHHNNFINNSLGQESQVNIEGYWLLPFLINGSTDEDPKYVEGSADIWDDGNEGNYWSDYNKADADQNGIGDSPYVMNENNQDNYPLMEKMELETVPEFDLVTVFFAVTTVTLVMVALKKRQNQTTESRTNLSL